LQVSEAWLQAQDRLVLPIPAAAALQVSEAWEQAQPRLVLIAARAIAAALHVSEAWLQAQPRLVLIGIAPVFEPVPQAQPTHGTQGTQPPMQ
jgi:hypothetical protein